MRLRTLVALALLPLLVGVLVAPWPAVLLLALFAAACVVTVEILRFSPAHPHPLVLLFTLASLAALFSARVAAYAGIGPSYEKLLLLILLAHMFTVGLTLAFQRDQKHALHHLGLSVVAVTWAGLAWSTYLDLRWAPSLPGGFDLLSTASGPANSLGILYATLPIALCVAFDTGAYFTGTFLGKNNRLGLTSSPNKSWAGLAGGVAVATAIGALVLFLTDRFAPGTLSLSVFQERPVASLVFFAVLSLVGQAGDLIESALKRAAGVKDSGRLIAGHGGLFDRIDSWIPAGAVMYFYVSFFPGAT